MLHAQGKSDLLNQLRSVLPSYASCIYIRQPAPLGLGHAVLCAQPAVGAEPFFVHLADDLIRSEVACLAQMARVYEAKRASVLGVRSVPRRDTEKYGIVAVEADNAVTSRVRSIVEKPKPADAPSNLAVVGRYVLAPAIFEHLEKHRAGRRRGDPAHRRHRRADARGGRVRLSLRGQALRLRQQARLPAGDRRVCARPPAARRPLPQVSRGPQAHGSHRVTSAPPPARFARLSRPPCASTISRQAPVSAGKLWFCCACGRTGSAYDGCPDGDRRTARGRPAGTRWFVLGLARSRATVAK